MLGNISLINYGIMIYDYISVIDHRQVNEVTFRAHAWLYRGGYRISERGGGGGGSDQLLSSKTHNIHTHAQDVFPSF